MYQYKYFNLTYSSKVNMLSIQIFYFNLQFISNEMNLIRCIKQLLDLTYTWTSFKYEYRYG